jgi:uncharacterized phage protein gp47/JayE
MAYFAPYIDASGLHIPTYQDILEYYLANAKDKFGQDIYLDTDSPDYQMLSIQALVVNDAMQSLQLEYNNRSPKTAIGAALDSLIKLNGMTRKKDSYSSVVLTLTGKPFYEISGCIAGDINGNKWLIPTTGFDADGNCSVTAICSTPGAVVAPVNTIDQIITPVFGWYSVTNLVTAVVGLPVEKDSVVRARQAISTELSSETLLAATKAGIGQIEGVSKYEVYENKNSAPDVNGIPGHTISAVVEGGLDYSIASVIYANKGPGCGTYGTAAVEIADPVNSYSNTINFYRPTYQDIFGTINVHPLNGWQNSMLDDIQAAVVNYINGMKIGQTITVFTGLLNAVNSAMPDITNPAFSVQLIKAGTTFEVQATTDIAIGFNRIAQTVADKIVVSQV